MRYLKTLSIISAMSAIAMAPAAFAGDTNTASEAEMAKTENTQVLAAVATADMIPVQDEDGNIYYNHYVSDAELFDASIDHEIVDTYKLEYNGRIYTNKIVTD